MEVCAENEVCIGSGRLLVHYLAFYAFCGTNYFRKSSLKSWPLIPHDQKVLEFLQFWASLCFFNQTSTIPYEARNGECNGPQHVTNWLWA